MIDTVTLVSYWEKGNGKFVECECHHYTFMSLEHLRNQHEAVASTFDRYKEKEKNDPASQPKYMVVLKDVYGLRAYICERDYKGDWRTILEGEVEVVRNLVKDLNK